MEVFNFYLGWVFLLAGLLAGALIGMFFHGDDWLGGYGTWRRRMVRLAHVSLVGTGLLNLAFALSVRYLGWEHAPPAAAVLFLVGALSMPSVCLLAAWRKPLRHLFAIPVVSLIGAAAIFLASAVPR